MTGKTCKTQLYELHKERAKLIVFAGFEMPLWYMGVIPEHLAVRNGVGIFDISHMGRFSVKGIDSERFLNFIITNDVSALSRNSAQYSVMCNEEGGILDDFVIYRVEQDEFMIVFNAGNREKDYKWLIENVEDFNVKIENVSDDVAMLAVQGPKAEKALQRISTADLCDIERFKCGRSRFSDTDVFVSRTGYTGEDGFEIFVWNASLAKPDNIVRAWNAILEAGQPFGIEPCGLGARDTLRLEAGMCLYGNDIDQNKTPLEARLSFTVRFEKENFIGKKALLKQRRDGVRQKRVGLKMIEQGIPRPGFEICDKKGEKIGYVTSGTFSPLLRCGIGMGYVQTPQAHKGNLVSVKIRDRLAEGKIVPFPFYDTEKYGYKRKITK